jgi:hypothetical protein
MAVVQVSTLTPKPDRFEDWLELARKSKPIWERAGGKNVRVLAGLVAGEATGSFVWIVEADDFAAHGAVLDKFFADAGGQEVVSSLSAGDSPIPKYQNPTAPTLARRIG